MILYSISSDSSDKAKLGWEEKSVDKKRFVKFFFEEKMLMKKFNDKKICHVFLFCF